MNKNTNYEILAKEIYELLLREEHSTAKVLHNVNIQGKATKHQIDVYWEFKTAGTTHRVAIECKNYNSLVSIGRVRDFYGVLSDIGNITGIMISKEGFQQGAQKFAQYYGINLRELRETTSNEDWKNRIKNIEIKLQRENCKEFKFNIDEKWLVNNGYTGTGTVKISGNSNDIWLLDNQGKKIKTLLDIQNSEASNIIDKDDVKVHVHLFEDGYIKTMGNEVIKLHSIECHYEFSPKEIKKIVLRGEDFVKAILKDVTTGNITFFNKDGGVK